MDLKARRGNKLYEVDNHAFIEPLIVRAKNAFEAALEAAKFLDDWDDADEKERLYFPDSLKRKLKII